MIFLGRLRNSDLVLSKETNQNKTMVLQPLFFYLTSISEKGGIDSSVSFERNPSSFENLENRSINSSFFFESMFTTDDEGEAFKLVNDVHKHGCDCDCDVKGVRILMSSMKPVVLRHALCLLLCTIEKADM